MRIERAQAVGQFFRQHRHDATREIDTGRAQNGVLVQRRFVAHIMAHVGNRHQQTIGRGFAPAFDRLAIDRIVKIARVFTVNRDQWHVAQINAMGQITRNHGIGQLRGLTLGCLGKYMRDTEFSYRNFNFHARIIGIAQHFHHATGRHGIAVAIGFQRHHDHLIGRCAVQIVCIEQNVGTQAYIVRIDQPDTLFINDVTDHL